MAQITSGSLTIVDVTDGAPGLNNTTVFLYRRAVNAPDKPTGNLTYTFATASITGALEGWVQSIDELTGSNPIWMIAAVASSNGETDVIESSEWAGPIKMAQNGQDGLPGAPGTNGLNQATIFIYKRDDSATTPSDTIYTFATGGFTVPSGWSKTIPTEPKGKPCWVTSAIAISAEATVELNWAAPSILVEDGSDGKDGTNPIVTATDNGVKIVDGDGNETYITNGADGTSYYTFVRYSKNANGSGYVATPTSETIYIGVYTGTKSSPPAYNDSGWTWSRYVGADGQPGTQGPTGPTGPTGPQGVSVAATRELYYLKTNSTDPARITNANQIHTTDDVNQWTSVVPTYIGSGKYYTCIETTLSNGNVVWSTPVENKGLTDANVNAANAIEIARGVKQHFFWVATDKSEDIPAGAYVAEQAEESFYSNPTKGNILTRSDGIWIRNGADKLATLQGGGLTFLVPTGSSKGQKSVSLDGSGLTFYNIGSSNSAAATLASDGLEITNGSIVLGTISGTNAGNVTLSNKNFTRAINGTSHNDLRFAIGSKFGVASDGTLYSSGLDSVVSRVDIAETSLGNKVDTSTFNTLSQTVDGNSASITTLTTITTNNGLTKTTNITNTVNTVSQTATGNSSKISSLTNTLGTNADGTTKAGDIVHRTSAVEQDLSGFKTTVSKTYHKTSDFNTYKAANDTAVAAAKKAGDDAQADLDEYKGTVSETYATKSSLTQTAEGIRTDVSSTYETKTDASAKLTEAKGDATTKANKALTDAKADTTNKLKSYYTKTETDSAITQKAGEISLSVAQTEISKIEVGGRNALQGNLINDALGFKTTEDFQLKGWATQIWDSSAVLSMLEPNTKYTIHYDAEVVSLATAPTLYSRTVGFWLYSNLTPAARINCNSETLVEHVVGSKGHFEKTFTTPATLPSDYRILAYTARYTTNGNTPYDFDTIKFSNLKLEKGNKATDWTPAPEDAEAYTDTQISAAKAEIKVTTDNISSEVSKVSSAKYVTSSGGGWTLENIKVYAAEGHIENWNVTSTENVRAGDVVYVYGKDTTRDCYVYIKTTVRSVGSSTRFSGISHGYEDILPVETIKSTINQSADSVKIQAKHVEIDGTATFNAIKSSTDAAYDAKGAADSINIGGRNLWAYGSDCQNSLDGLNNFSNGFSIVTEDGYKCAHASGALTTTKYLQSKLGYVPKPSETFTYSCYVKIKNIVRGTTNPMCEFYFSGQTIDGSWKGIATYKVYLDGELQTGVYGFDKQISDTKWHHLAVVGTYANANFTATFLPNVYLRDCTGDLYVRNLKAERGNKATDWTPAPEDVQAEIDAVSDAVDDKADKTAAVAEEQLIYISKASGTTSVSGTTTWITETGNKQNTWTTKRPTYNSSYPVLFVAKQKKVVSGTVTCTTPVKDDTTTVIDGGHITTGTIDSNRLNADTIKVNAANIQGSLTIGQLPSTVAETSDIPTKVSELSNDSGYQTSSQVSSAINNVRSWYATCSTAAGTAAKVATITPTTTAFTTSVLTAGTLVNVKFTVTNTAAVADLTLNINNTGAKHIKTLRYGVINNIAGAGYLAKDTTYQFTYDGTYWVMQENYNSDTQNRIRWQNVIAAAEAITSGHIICGTASGYRNIAANVSFDMAYPLLYAETAIAKGATSGTRDNNFLEINGINASSNGTITSGAANKVLYLKGTISGNTFTISASPFMTTAVPSSQDNICYIPIGIMYSATNIYFKSSDQIYAYKDGAFGQISLREASAAAKTATTYITHIDNNGIRVHPSSTQNNSVVINANGMEVFKGGTAAENSVAFYGDTARIGKESGSHLTLASDSMSMSDGNKNVFNLIQKTMYICWTHNYKGRQFTNSTDRHIDSWDTNTSISTWNSITVNYKLNNTSKTKKITSISNGVLVNDEIYVHFNYSGTIITLTYGRGSSAASSAVIKLESAVVDYVTDEKLSQLHTGIYPNTTVSGPLRVGNGTSDSERKNSLLVDWSGSGKFGGDVLAFCNSDSSGGMSLTKTEENLEICTQSNSKGAVTIDSYRVGRMVVLRIRMKLAGTTEAGQRINTISLAGKHLPKPLGNVAMSASYYGTHAIGLALTYNSSASRYELAIHNASSTAFTPASGYDLWGTLTYICDMDQVSGAIQYIDD